MRKLVMGLAVSSMILTACNKEPEVSMTVPSTGEVGVAVAMTNNSDVKKVYNAQWSFGDGGAASTWNASHVYDEPGDYTVTLTATNKKGNMATSQTQVVSVTDNGISALEDKMEEEALASDAWWSKAIGTWKFSTGSINFVDCQTAANSLSISGNAQAQKFMFHIFGGGDHGSSGDSYYTDEYSDRKDYSFRYVDDTHVWVGGYEMPYTATTGSSPHADATMSSGIYEYTNTGTEITLRRVNTDEINYFDGTNTKYCEDKTTFTYKLIKQ